MKKLVDSIVKTLKQHGVVVMRYDAYSTNSVYLKMDYGVCNSLRISDHQGKKHLSYRYNLLKDVKNSYVKTEKGFVRHFYGFGEVDACIRDILQSRNEKIEKYGLIHYQRFMKQNEEEKSGTKGFWKDARLV